MLKTQPERYTIKLLFKVQILPDHPTSKTKSGVLHLYPFVNFTGLLMEFPL